MNEKKELKKLNLEKEEIVNLNESEMDSVKGGSTYGCVIGSIGLIVETYKLGQTESLWRCPTQAPCDCGCGTTTEPTPTPTPSPNAWDL